MTSLFDSADTKNETAAQSSGPPPRTIVWLDPEQLPLARDIAGAANLEIIAAGSAGGAGASSVAEALGAERASDLRHAVFSSEIDLLLLLTFQGAAASDLPAIIERAKTVVSLEPVLSGVRDADLLEAAASVRLAPLLRDSASIQLFDEIRESFGPVRSVSVQARSGAGEGSLYARLTDAIDAIEHLAGPIEQIDACLSGPLSGAPASLREMHGHVTLNARFSNNICACAQASNYAGRWSRGVTVLGESGCVRMTDGRFDWWNPAGEPVDSGSFEQFEARPAELIADQIRRILDPRRPAPAPRNDARLVAVCEAARLSLRTGQNEAPRKILEMLQV